MKHTIEIDTTMYFTHNGVGSCLFIGDDDGSDFNMTWDQLIDYEFEMQTIPKVLGYGDPLQKADVLTLDAVRELDELVTALEDAAKKMRDRLENSMILDRQAWLQANNGEYNQENRDEFLKYFSYDMVTNNE